MKSHTRISIQNCVAASQCSHVIELFFIYRATFLDIKINK